MDMPSKKKNQPMQINFSDPQSILMNAPIGVFTSLPEGRFLSVNLALARMFGYDSPEELIKSVTDIGQQLYADPSDRKKFIRMLEKHDEVINYESRMRRRGESDFWVSRNARTVRDEMGTIVYLQGFTTDITARKLDEEKLKKIEWMASQKTGPDIHSQLEDHDQGYGDLSALNQNGIILSSIGPERLKDLASDYLELLGTSSAIYEFNGDYAFGIFSSGWCRMMDCASRKLCGTVDNAEALSSGKWLCHESCWTDCSKKAIAKRSPVDIECSGGIRLYAAPIFSEGEVVGVINFGYGDPPKDPDVLRQLADTYNLNVDDLVRESNAYDSRPPFIIEMAKNRLHAAAKLIGSMIEKARAEKALRESEEKHRRLFETMTQGVVYHSADGTIISANPAAERILGLSFDQMRGKTSMDPRWKMTNEDGTAVSGSDHPAMITLRTGETVGPVVRGVFRPEKNAHIWLSITAIPLFQPGEKKPFQAYATFEDITERKQAEEQYQILFREMLDGFALHEIICNESGKPVDYRFIAVNPAFERSTGLKGDAIIGRTVLEILPETESHWIETYGQVALTGEPVVFDNFSAALQKHFIVTAFSPVPGQFACISVDFKKDVASKPRFFLC